MESEEQRQMRRVAFFAIVISTVAVIASVVTLPMLYSYVQSFQSHMIQETEFCKIRSRDIWQEVNLIQSSSEGRFKRQYGTPPAQPSYGPAPAVNAEPVNLCCNCQQGPPGPPGAPGDDGNQGIDGKDGVDGQDGKDGAVLRSAIPREPCIICPRGPTGPQGSSGTKGKRIDNFRLFHHVYFRSNWSKGSCW